jgi:hypothetical protein
LIIVVIQWEWLSIQRDTRSSVLREVASQSYALATVVVPNEQADSSPQGDDALGKAPGPACQPLEVMAQVGVQALDGVRLLLPFGDDMTCTFRPQQVRVDCGLISTVVTSRRQRIDHPLHPFPTQLLQYLGSHDQPRLPGYSGHYVDALVFLPTWVNSSSISTVSVGVVSVTCSGRVASAAFTQLATL